MRHKLTDICIDANTLAASLHYNGCQHRRYKMYTSMERALGILLSGNMYFSNGSTWNDLQDRMLMNRCHQYGGCFSWSTVENIAMWMLYGGECGKKGAMLDFPQSIMMELLGTATLELGNFDKGTYVPQMTLSAPSDFTISLTDVVYSQLSAKGDKVTLTLGDEHAIVPADMLDHNDIFYKYYAWSYERECRLIIHVKEHVFDICETIPTCARIHLSDAVMRSLKDNLYRSPVYDGSSDIGKPSKLYQQVEWNLK